MVFMETFDRFLRQIKKARSEIKVKRPDFWSKNRINFKNNIKTLTSFFKAPEGWNVNVIASSFLLNKEVMPYDMDVWSFSDIVSATKEMGQEIVIFFNKTDLEFLSAPALLPIVIHEMYHAVQAAREPKKYVLSTVEDDINIKYEEEADAEVRKYNDEFRKQNVLEKIMFCYDKRGWEGAEKMAYYLFKEAEKSFGGGYDQGMKKDEYQVFQKAEDERDIELFIDYFIKSIEELEKKQEAEEEAEKKAKEKKAEEAEKKEEMEKKAKEKKEEADKK